jgi:hypothetical protein
MSGIFPRVKALLDDDNNVGVAPEATASRGRVE